MPSPVECSSHLTSLPRVLARAFYWANQIADRLPEPASAELRDFASQKVEEWHFSQRKEHR